MKVAVIVDDLDPARRRRCFWDNQLDAFPDVHYDLISLLHNMEERKFFDVDSYDIIIFNWCVLDGALMYASDRVQAIVRFYDEYFIDFVRKGGILIMEDQPKRWRPEQEAYDVLLKGNVVVVPREPYLFASKVTINRRLKKHPLIQHLPAILYSEYAYAPSESWFPADSTSDRSIQELHPSKMYAGAFHRWQSDWLPLLYTDDGTHPVMLVKTEGLGLWIVTTMFLASSNIHELLQSLILGAKGHMLEIQRFHERERYLRKWGIARLITIFVALAAAIYAALASKIVVAHIPYGNTVFGNVAISLAIAIILSSFTFLRKYISRSLRAVLNR
jgi:hypothetical protein